MPVLTDPRSMMFDTAHGARPDVAAALTRAPRYLVSILSGGGVSTWSAVPPREVGVPVTMMQPVSFVFDEREEGELMSVSLVAVDETADDW